MNLAPILPGDVFLLRSRGYWYSDAIAWFMGRDSKGHQWSHCGTVIDLAEWIGPLTLETSDYEMTYGSIFKYASKPEKYHLQVFRVPGAFNGLISQRAALAKTDEMLYGNMYGYLQLLSLGVRRLFMRVKITVHNFIRQGQVCTAGPLTYLGQGISPIFCGRDPEAFDTVEFAEMLYKADAQLIFESGAPA